MMGYHGRTLFSSTWEIVRKVILLAHAKSSIAKRIVVTIGIVFMLLIAGFAWYVSDYYHADENALAAIVDENGPQDGVTVLNLSDDAIAFVAENPPAGLIFYPGGKVQPESYAPLLTRFAQKGITSILVKPLFNLAILDMDAADGIIDQFPDIQTWLLAGHSLGGVAASDYLSRHESEYVGIILLAAYPSSDLSDYAGNVLLIYGSNDGVMNREKYAEAKAKLPNSAHEEIIDGGNHAFFGNYGFQEGDGTPNITHEEQQEKTASALPAL